MKLSPFLAIFAGSSSADPVEFWGESNLFAYQVRESIPKNGLANRFIKKYDEVREVARYYQSSGICDSGVTSPTYEPVSFDAVFDRRASPSANIAALSELLDQWIQSYACVEDADVFEEVRQALSDIVTIGRKNINRDQDVFFHLSEDLMTYEQARAYCFSQDMWLASPANFGQQEGIMSSEYTNKFVWFDSWKANEGECWYQNSWFEINENGNGVSGLNEGATDCNNKYHAVCQSGQIYEKACLTFKKAPYGETEFVDAQAYCNLAGGYLPFFNNKKELNEFNSQVATRQMIGLVRDTKLASGWATRTGEEASFFSWRRGEPNNAGGHEDCVATASDTDLLWNDIPCGYPYALDFSCRFDRTVHVWDSCPIHEMPERPPCYDPCDGFENCQTFVDSCPIAPTDNNLIATVDDPTINFEVTVDVWFPYAPGVNSDYFQIFRMGTGSRQGDFGDRFFGMWLNKRKSNEYQIQMNAVQSLSTIPGYFTKQMVSDIDSSEMQRWSTFKYSQSPNETDSSKTTSKLFKDGVLMAEFDQNTADIEIDQPLYVWASDPWYSPASEYRVKNFSMKKFPSTPLVNVASIIVSSGQNSGVIQRFDWDGESLGEGRVVGDVGDYKQLMRPLLFPFSMVDECGLIETTSDPVGAFSQIDDKWGLEGGWLQRIASTFFSDGTQVDLDFRTPPPADGGNMGRLFATQLGKVNGQYYVFGGFKAHYAIYSVDGCEMEELPVKLKTQIGVYGPEVRTLVQADGNEKAYICFTDSEYRGCDTFDGTEVVTSPYQSNTYRRDASIANYRDGLLAFGGTKYTDPDWEYNRSAEIFTSEDGFVPTTDLIFGMAYMTSATIGGDRVFSFGGRVDVTDATSAPVSDQVSMYYEGVWSDLGPMMVAKNWRISAIVFDYSLPRIAAPDCDEDDPDC